MRENRALKDGQTVRNRGDRSNPRVGEAEDKVVHKSTASPISMAETASRTGRTCLLDNEDCCYLVASENTTVADVMLRGRFIERLVINPEPSILPKQVILKS